MSRRARQIASIVVAVALLATLVWDLGRRPEDQWSAKVLLTGLDLYQASLSSLMATAGVRCRFEPSCSHYAQAVIRQDGALGGSWRTVRRLVRCGPWTPAGTQDPP